MPPLVDDRAWQVREILALRRNHGAGHLHICLTAGTAQGSTVDTTQG